MDDGCVGVELLGRLGAPVASFRADGAYDTRAVFAALDAVGMPGIDIAIPPRRTAAASRPGRGTWRHRETALRRIDDVGRRRWRKESTTVDALCWADGTHALRFSGHELMEKLAVLVPMPRANLVRYHGVLAPAARWRSQVVPRADAEGRVCGHRSVGGRVPTRRVSWAQLLKRVFIEDVLRCRGCGGPRRLLAEVTNPDAVRAILTHLGIDPRTEGSAGVRGPPGIRGPPTTGPFAPI